MTSFRSGIYAFLEQYLRDYAVNDYDALDKGYAPKNWNVKDFSLIKHNDRWHLFHILGQNALCCLSPDAECRIGHASTADFVTWVTHDPIIPAIPETWESHHIFAPFIFRWQNHFHIIYSGINRNMYECLGHAVSDDLFLWQRDEGPIIDPKSLNWAAADSETDIIRRRSTPCRDPHVYIENNNLYLYFTALEKDSEMPVIGCATSTDAIKWQNAGIVYRGWDNSFDCCGLLESSCVHRLDSGKYFLTFNTRQRVRYVISDNPLDFKTGEYLDLPTEENYVSLEVLSRNPDKWLVAYFGGKAGYRMSLGTLEWENGHITGGKRINSKDELCDFSI